MAMDCNRRGFLKGGSALAASVALGVTLPASAAAPPTLVGALTAIGPDGFLRLLESDMSVQGAMWADRTISILRPSVRAAYARGFSTIEELDGVASFDRLEQLVADGSADPAIRLEARAALASLPGYSPGRGRSHEASDQFGYCAAHCVVMLRSLAVAGDAVAPSVLALNVDWGAIRGHLMLVFDDNLAAIRV